MPKRYIYRDELYPYFDFDDNHDDDGDYEVSDELITEHREVMAAFSALQAKLKAICEGGT